MQGTELLSDDPAANPDFSGAHHVHVPYCSGDTHRGTRNTTGTETWGLYFSGHLNVEGIVDALSAKGLTSATHVLLSGGSAGGIGTFINLDWLAGHLGRKVVVKGAPNAGWFFPGSLPDDSVSKLWQSYVHPRC
eukprot:gene33214-61155_t